MGSGLVGRTLVPLAVVTTAVLGVGTWASYVRTAGSEREAELADVAGRARERARRNGAVFDRVGRQLVEARLLIERRWRLGDQPRPPAEADDGSRRDLPAAGAPPLAAFVAARAAGDPNMLRAAAIARDLLADLAPVWTADLAGIAMAAPGGWYVGFGDDQATLARDMLPDDPVLIGEEERVARDAPPGEVRWTGAWREPASGRRFVSAAIVAVLPGTGRVAITQPLAIDEVLRAAASGEPAGVRSLVVDRDGMEIGTVVDGDSAAIDVVTESERPLAPELARALASAPTGDAASVRAGDVWLALSRFPGPDWTVVAVHPAAAIELRARTQARSTLYVGLALIASQLVLLIGLLGRGIARPLRALVAAAGRLGRGERGVALDTARGDEVGELAQALARLDAAVAGREAELETALAAGREREEFARALVDSAADAVVVLVDGRIVDANPQAAALFATPAEALRGRTVASLAGGTPDDATLAAATFAARAAVALAGTPQHFAWSAGRVDGSHFDAEVGLARVDLPGTARLLAVIRDVSERNRIQEQVRQMEKLESVGQLAGGVAHDFNNMLAGIMGSAELLARPALEDGRRRQLIDNILLSCERSAALTRRLLDFARRGRGAEAPVDAHRVVRDTVALLERTVDRRIGIRVELTARRQTVIGDSAQLQNALLNLALNARDAMPDGGAIVFTSGEVELDPATAAALRGAAVSGPHLTLQVVDTGTGIPAELLDRVFEPFFTTKPIGKGTGLGLAAVYRAVCDHHGGIAVASAPGRGTTVTLYLPLAPAEAREPTPTPTPTPVAAGARRATVLVVDDEDLVRELAAHMLGVLGYDVLAAPDGRAAVEVFRANAARIDLILLDSEMPGLRGLDCLRAIRTIDPNARAVLCSGFAREESPDDTAKAGIVGYVDKPFRLYDLSRAIEAALGAPAPAVRS